MNEMINSIIQAEWAMFQQTQNVGGRATCQDNYQQFYGMRFGQFASWSEKAKSSYRKDLLRAEAEGRNMVAEKYLRMMEFTFSEEYEAQVHNIPSLTAAHHAMANEICDALIEQTVPLREQYPLLFNEGRPLYTSEDGRRGTSIQTYQRGELYTYSMETLEAIQAHLLELETEGRSLAREILCSTIRYYGYETLEEAEENIRKRS